MANKLRYPHLVEKASRLYLELGSTHKVAAELGIDKTTAWSYIKLSGIDMSAMNVHKMASRNKSIVVDGITFYWSKKGYYRGVTAPGRREMLSSYMYRKIHGTEKPKWLTIVFKEGNRDNYAPENLDFVSASEWARFLSKDEDRHALLCQSLDEGRKVYKDMCEKKPYIKVITARRAWNTRRRNDPDNEWAAKMVETKNRNAEERGFFYTEEQRRHMSDAHKGKTKAVLATMKNETAKAAIRAKLGMRG